MAKQTNLFLTYQYRTQGTIFVPADTTSAKTVAQHGVDVNGSSNDSNLTGLSISSTSATNAVIRFQLTNGSTNYPWLSVVVPAIDVNGIAQLEVLSTYGNGRILDNNGNYYYRIAAGWTILANCVTTLPVGSQLTILSICEDF